MNQLNESARSLFDAFAAELQTQWLEEHAENITVSWSAESDSPAASGLISYSWVLSVDSASRILLSAPAETWREITGLSEEASAEDLKTTFHVRFTPAIEKTVRSRFGAEVLCTEEDDPEAPSPEWTSVQFILNYETGTELSIRVSINPDLEIALGASEAAPAGDEESSPRPAPVNSVGILMDVEMPLSVALGRTRMRLKNLLHLTNGSVVELDQELGDEVEIRVNKCVIAYGEIVAVEGNYAVRILRMAPARNGAGLPGITPERAA